MRLPSLRRVSAFVLALTLATQSALAVPDQSDKKARNQGPPIIRDAEIEGLLRIYSGPIFKAAGINAKAARVVVIGAPSINAFVSGANASSSTAG